MSMMVMMTIHVCARTGILYCRDCMI